MDSNTYFFRLIRLPFSVIEWIVREWRWIRDLCESCGDPKRMVGRDSTKDYCPNGCEEDLRDLADCGDEGLDVLRAIVKRSEWEA
jgi:hypothetical protein